MMDSRPQAVEPESLVFPPQHNDGSDHHSLAHQPSTPSRSPPSQTPQNCLSQCTGYYYNDESTSGGGPSCTRELGQINFPFSTYRPELEMEPFEREIRVVNERTQKFKVTMGLFDSGSEHIDLISADFARLVGLKFEPDCAPRPRPLDRFLDKVFPWRKGKRNKASEKFCGANGSPVCPLGKVRIRWYCKDKPYNMQVLFFKKGYYITEHFVVENSQVDLIFSLQTWQSLNLRLPPVFPINKMPNPDSSKLTERKTSRFSADLSRRPSSTGQSESSEGQVRPDRGRIYEQEVQVVSRTSSSEKGPSWCNVHSKR
ncbi:hypothetical protein HDK64DRAFT_75450 [Phyllosticta capitalensis]